MPINATGVVAVLEAPGTDRRPVMRQLEEEAPHASLVGALAADRPLTRELAADILGRRAKPESADALLVAIRDPVSGVRPALLAAQWALEQLGRSAPRRYTSLRAGELCSGLAGSELPTDERPTPRPTPIEAGGKTQVSRADLSPLMW